MGKADKSNYKDHLFLLLPLVLLVTCATQIFIDDSEIWSIYQAVKGSIAESSYVIKLGFYGSMAWLKIFDPATVDAIVITRTFFALLVFTVGLGLSVIGGAGAGRLIMVLFSCNSIVLLDAVKVRADCLVALVWLALLYLLVQGRIEKTSKLGLFFLGWLAILISPKSFLVLAGILLASFVSLFWYRRFGLQFYKSIVSFTLLPGLFYFATYLILPVSYQSGVVDAAGLFFNSNSSLAFQARPLWEIFFLNPEFLIFFVALGFNIKVFIESKTDKVFFFLSIVSSILLVMACLVHDQQAYFLYSLSIFWFVTCLPLLQRLVHKLEQRFGFRSVEYLNFALALKAIVVAATGLALLSNEGQRREIQNIDQWLRARATMPYFDGVGAYFKNPAVGGLVSIGDPNIGHTLESLKSFKPTVIFKTSRSKLMEPQLTQILNSSYVEIAPDIYFRNCLREKDSSIFTADRYKAPKRITYKEVVEACPEIIIGGKIYVYSVDLKPICVEVRDSKKQSIKACGLIDLYSHAFKELDLFRDFELLSSEPIVISEFSVEKPSIDVPYSHLIGYRTDPNLLVRKKLGLTQ